MTKELYDELMDKRVITDTKMTLEYINENKLKLEDIITVPAILATYLGKEEKYFPFIETYLEYSDGYKFDAEKEWIYNPALHGWLNSTKIAPLTSETGMYLEYEVPMEVKDNENEPIVIHIISEGQEAIYKVR